MSNVHACSANLENSTLQLQRGDDNGDSENAKHGGTHSKFDETAGESPLGDSNVNADEGWSEEIFTCGDFCHYHGVH
eukprot:2558863-Karenia_brevis.AAC.1